MTNLTNIREIQIKTVLSPYFPSDIIAVTKKTK